MEDYPWTFVAESPTGRRHEIDLDRLGSSPHQWTATFTFSEPGRWEIGLDRQHLGSPVDPALGARVTVAIRSRDEPTVPVEAALAVLVFIAAAIAGSIFYRTRSGRRRR